MSKDRKPEIIQARRRDGTTLEIIVPMSRVDVEMQPDAPAYVLAVLAFSSRVNGVRRWSQFTLETLRRLERQFGSETLRSVLCGLLDDIAAGFRPTNPVGIFIHRVRLTADSGEMQV